jgi:hypothetical protein
MLESGSVSTRICGGGIDVRTIVGEWKERRERQERRLHVRSENISRKSVMLL